MTMPALAVMEAAREPYSEADSAPRSEDTETEELGDEIALMAAHLHAYKRRYLELLAEFDRRRGREPGGHTSCAEWLAYRTGCDRNTAREHVRVPARALEELPRTGEAMAEGRLSFSQARALTRVATPEAEEELLALAEGVPTSTLERMVRAWKKGTRQEEADRERELHRLRRLSVFPDDDGGYVVRGRLPPEAGAVLMRAIEAASDALYRDEEEYDPEASPRQRRREAARRRADALGLLAERALAAGFGEEDDAPVSGTRAERYQVFLHVDRDTLSGHRSPEASGRGEPGRSELEDGTRVSAPMKASSSRGRSSPSPLSGVFTA